MKKFIKFAFVAAVVAVAGYNVYQTQSVMDNMSELVMANVEALAADDEVDGITCSRSCGDSIGQCWEEIIGTIYCKFSGFEEDKCTCN